ncbi:aldehyde dehydrogenase family protein [Haladaptatus sp. DJG-WS-42]|uniref:aldehyde dehydrogenase family protein n=1 Tax=Haladaptatus sp. DJG-WS-42 TaxID=3120516 RepID=UPI0030D52703
MVEYELLIDGDGREGEATLSVTNPATGESLGSVAKGTREQAREAIAAAARTKDEWASAAPSERTAALTTVADELEAVAGDLAYLLAEETGKPLATAEGEVGEAIAQFRFYAGVTDKVRGDTVPTPDHRFNYTKRVPYGVTAHIVPWNYPLLLGTRSIAAALATGNTLVVKPPSQAPLATMWVCELLVEATPAGVVNVVPGSGSEVGDELASNADVDAITFTGSVGVGQHVLSAAAEHITPVDVELGGKAPAIVLDDADVENAARGVVQGIFSNNGQNCVATSRLVVHESLHDELVSRILEKTERITLGPGTDPETDMGPVITDSALEEMLAYVEGATAEGATVIAGGKRPDDPALEDGHYLEPTIIDGVTNDMTVACEEIFGPVLSIITVDSTAEAIEVANDSRFALAASLWTDRLEATQLADDLDHGLVAVNSFPVSMPQSPWGGNKESGIGREGGLEGVEAFTTVNSVVVEFDEMEDPYL